jgi:tRNA (guanine37-N1)-methyltransferase
MLKFDVITLFPQLFSEHLNNLPFKKAIEKNTAEYNLWDLKKFSINNYGSVDDRTYGGGVGMVLMIEPIFKALSEIYDKKTLEKRVKGSSDVFLKENQRVIILSPRGERFNQKKAEELSKCNQISLICGRYEGLDARIEESIATDVISIGDFVLSGGEIPALAIMESITRLMPGVLEKEEAAKIESFSKKEKEKIEGLSNGEEGLDENINKYIEYPQYTRPEDFMGLKVPQVLLSGNHAEIEKWRKENSKKFEKLK